MVKRLIVPETLKTACAAAGMSPGIASRGHVFLTGATGSGPDGTMPETERAQFQQAFDKLAMVLAEADLTMDAVVEMTSYHVGLRQHFDLFDEIRRQVFAAPYPAWTAVEVAGLRRIGAVVEIRMTAELPEA